MLIADRFISLNGRTIDLACGQPVLLRQLPPAALPEQLAWAERCAAMSGPAHDSYPVLVDYGLLNDGNRFEVRRTCDRSKRSTPVPRGTAIEPFIQQAGDLFKTGCFGEPRVLRLSLPGAVLRPSFLDAIARQARISGFVPLSVDLAANAERHLTELGRCVRQIIESRHLFLITHAALACDKHGWCARRTGRVTACPVAVARLMLVTGARSARPNILLLIGDSAARAITGRPACLVERETGHGPDRSRLNLAYPIDSVAIRPDMAAEAHERYQLGRPPDVIRLRARADAAIRDGRNGRAMHAERDLREVLGGLARRNDPSGAGWVALILGCLLLERGRPLDGARMFETSRAHFDRANDLQSAARATVYLGLAWTDEGRLSEAEAACRTAEIAARETGLGEVAFEARLGLARCLYWQGRFDEATVVVAALVDGLESAGGISAPAMTSADRAYPCEVSDRQIAVVRETQAVEPWRADIQSLSRRAVPLIAADRRVRALSLAARVALARGDLRAASAHGTRAVELAGCAARPIDACVAHTVAAAVRASLKDTEDALEHVRGGLRAARLSHAPLRALRLRLLACDMLREAGRRTEAGRLLRRLGTLDPARFPGLLRTRLQIVLGTDGRLPPGLVVASCPWRVTPARADVADEIAGVLQVCHEIEDEAAALGRVCEAVRERMRAVAVGVVGRNGGAPALLARSGPAAGRSTIADRVLDTGLAVPAGTTGLGMEAASPIRYAGAVIGVVSCRWPADAFVDAGRAGCLLSAAAAATAPHVRTLLDRRELQHPGSGPDQDQAHMVGVSAAIQELRKAAARAAAAPFPVLIEGESGSGKELVARAIHRDSPRRSRRFCALNCAALTDDLLEAELFGHARGAFTGAICERVGLFEEADGGTLFLDEVADLSPRAQAKLLRVLQDGEVRRIGENVPRHVDARVIAATNRRLDREVAAGTFRQDLFYRLNVVHIDVPPLRDRPEDIPVLAGHFWQQSTERIDSRATLAPSTLAALAGYDWPGNVRELQNVMAALAVSAPRRGSVGPASLPAVVARAETTRATLDDARRVFERRFVQAALARAGGHRGRAAAALGISRQGLAKLMARLDLNATDRADHED